MGFFRKILGGKGEAGRPAPRVLERPQDLQPGDIVKFGFTAQQVLSNRSFTVEEVATLDLGGDACKKALFTLAGGHDRVRLAISNDNAGERLELGLSLLPADVEQIFPLEGFIDLLDPESGVLHTLERIGEPPSFENWTAPVYRQEAGQNAYRYPEDYRHRPMPEDAEAGRALSYYRLVSDDRCYALEVQVYDGGQTEVSLLAYLAPASIEELWPAAQDHA